jgi:hypothetical protein
MQHPTISSKIVEVFQTELAGCLKKWEIDLSSGDLLAYEQSASELMISIYNKMSKIVLKDAAKAIISDYKVPARSQVTKASARFRINTGAEIEVESLYLKRTPQGFEGSRNIMIKHWNMVGKNSLGLCEKSAFMASICPSYDIANQSLVKFGTAISLSSVQDLTNNLANRVDSLGEENICLSAGENLVDKRVVISMDGGRSRTREYNAEYTDQGYDKYNTPWREPKLFVIDILDDIGQSKRLTQPIYGCRFGEEDVLNLLRRYLKKLQIEKAAQVQLIADGAQWIWKQLPVVLLDLGVPENRLIQTIDHFHAQSYLHSLINAMPKKVTATQRKQYLMDFKNHLWQGQIDKILEICQATFSRYSKDVKRWTGYFKKHTNRMQYADYEAKGLLKGSGIIESGIRRIINLRFKNASTFWHQNTVEKLYVLRASVLSGRWNILVNNLNKSN